ncbi:MAG: serine/threonine-protein kinase [Pseudomonadota bacterium]
MLDWQRIGESLEHALTLDRDSAAEFVAKVLASDDDRTAANRLLETLHTGFMRTRAAGDVAEHTHLPIDSRVGPWRIESLIGRGGMGEVYRAVRDDGLYEQAVALKLMHGGGATRNAAFEQERQRLARMTHPGVARIVDGGTTDEGRPYLVMELVDGAPIDQFVQTHNLDVAARVRLLIPVCAAVVHAHQQFILHRDIKVDNVLVDESGQPRLIDFGIAAALDEDELRGGPLTLYCAAPEQLLGQPLSVQTDVFALGVLMHEVLTGQRPKRNKDGGLSALQTTGLPEDLIAIMRKAMRTDPVARYSSAEALGEDLRAFLDRRPVAARDAGLAYRLQKLAMRSPVASLLAVGLVLSLGVGLAVSLKYASDARAEALRATEALARAEWQRNRSEATLAAQQAYSDILQRAFGGDEKTDELSEMLMSRWESAWESRADDPETAAATSYAVGRNFFFRGDAKRALTVFDPWMAEPIGPTPLLEIGEEVYAMMLARAGRDDEAEPRLRQLIERYSTEFRGEDDNLFNYSYRLARITREPDDLARAEALVLRLIENDTEPFDILYHHNQLGFLRSELNDRDGAYAAYQVSVETFDDNPQLAVYGRDVARLNLAIQELGFKRDLDRAKTLAMAIIDEDVALRGESAQQARAELILAMIAGEQGALTEAGVHYAKSIALFEKYTGTGSDMHLSTLASRAATLGDLRQMEAARTQLAEIFEIRPREEMDQKMRVITGISEMYLDALEGGDSQALEAAFKEMDAARFVRGNAILAYWYQRMVEQSLLKATLLDNP